MGLLRLVLAISVAIGHSSPIGPIRGIDPATAVEAFYVISGFYMSLVLGSKYGTAGGSILLFYTNRYLRLAPTYWVVFTVGVAGQVLLHQRAEAFALFAALPLLDRSWIVLTNLFLIGLDSLMFVRVCDPANPHLSFSPYLGSTGFAGARFILVPPAWSLGVELAFYLVAPLLARQRSRWLLAVIAASLGLRLVAYGMGFNRDPWTYRCFPLELAWFVIGMLGHRAYVAANGWIASNARSVSGCFAVITIACLIAGPRRGLDFFFLCLVAICVPFLFSLTRRWKNDTRIAELSYPVYLVHAFFAPVVKTGLLVCISSTLASIGLILAVERPLAAYRQRRVDRFKLAAATRHAPDAATP